MASRLNLAIDIDEPPEALFDLMADVGNEPAWNPDALEVKRIGDGPLAEGAESAGLHHHGQQDGHALALRLLASRLGDARRRPCGDRGQGGDAPDGPVHG